MVLSGNVVEHRIGSLLNGYSKRSRARRFWVGGQPPGPPAPGTRPEPGDVPPASQSVYRLPPFRFGPTTSVGGGAISVSQLASNRKSVPRCRARSSAAAGTRILRFHRAYTLRIVRLAAEFGCFKVWSCLCLLPISHQSSRRAPLSDSVLGEALFAAHRQAVQSFADCQTLRTVLRTSSFRAPKPTFQTMPPAASSLVDQPRPARASCLSLRRRNESWLRFPGWLTYSARAMISVACPETTRISTGGQAPWPRWGIMNMEAGRG